MMIEPIQKELEAAILDLYALVRDAAAAIHLYSRERWTVETRNGTRAINLEHPIEKDYDKFLYFQDEALVQRDTIKNLTARLGDYPAIQEALFLANGNLGHDLLWYYVLPITLEVLKREDAGTQISVAIAAVLRLFDAGMSSPTYAIKYSAPLRNFTCSEDELELADKVSIRRIPNEDMALHLNMLATHTNYHEFHDLEFQLESVVHRKRVSPRSLAGPDDIQTVFNEMEEALRLLKVGAVGILFNRAQVYGFFGPEQGLAYYAAGVRLYEDKKFFTYKLTQEDRPNLINVYESLKTLRKNRAFSVALRRFTGAYPKPMGDDRILDYWIALEALVMPDGKEGELRSKGATRLAWLFGNQGNRLEIFTKVQKSYDLRSNIAHGSKTSVELEDVTYLEDLVRRTMLHCVSTKNVPDKNWLNSLVLGALPDEIASKLTSENKTS